MFSKCSVAKTDTPHLTVPYEMAIAVWGSEPEFNQDSQRLCFFSVWAMLQVELEQALQKERAEKA